jgi:hypothetical protein
MPALKPTPERYCEQCGMKLERKRYRGKQLEPLGQFKVRRFCTWKCLKLAYHERPGDFGMKRRKSRDEVRQANASSGQ